MDLAAFQQLMESTYGHHDRERGVPATVAWLAEEVGELAQAVRKGTRGRAGARVRRRPGLAGVAGQPDGHRPGRRRRRYAAGCPRCGTAPCVCPHAGEWSHVPDRLTADRVPGRSRSDVAGTLRPCSWWSAWWGPCCSSCSCCSTTSSTASSPTPTGSPGPALGAFLAAFGLFGWVAQEGFDASTAVAVGRRRRPAASASAASRTGCRRALLQQPDRRHPDHGLARRPAGQGRHAGARRRHRRGARAPRRPARQAQRYRRRGPAARNRVGRRRRRSRPPGSSSSPPTGSGRSTTSHRTRIDRTTTEREPWGPSPSD